MFAYHVQRRGLSKKRKVREEEKRKGKEEKEQKGERKENGEKVAKARRPWSDIEMLIFLYIWFEHSNVINLGYIILLTSDLYKVSHTIIWTKKHWILISM